MEPAAGCARGHGPGRGQRRPLGGPLTSHVTPRCYGERSPYRVRGDESVPEVPLARVPCHTETLTSTSTRLWEMAGIADLSQDIPDRDELPTEALPVEPSTETGKDPSGIDLPPWLGKWGIHPEKEPHTTVPALPPSPPLPAEKPSHSVPQQSRLTRNWQKEVLVDPLDSRSGKDLGSDDFQHGYNGLPIHQFLCSLTDTSPPKDFPPPRALLVGQGQRKATLAAMLYKKYSKETEEEICSLPRRLESISTTHQDYSAMGFQSIPQPITQPHNYLTEQPTSFWLEQARGRPDVTTIFSRNIPFKKNAAFSTPITMYLGQPEPFNLSNPYDPLSSQLQPHKQ